MEDKKDQFEKVNVKMELVRSDDFRLYFTNNVQISVGQTSEVQIFFGQIAAPAITADSKPDLVKVDQGVGVVMTLLEFRKMLKVFQGHLPKMEAIAKDQKTSPDDEDE